MSDPIERWLETALRDADPARRARLRAEVLNHLAEARAAYETAGLSPEQALNAALADLGRPEETARALRQALPQPPMARLRAIRSHLGLPLLLTALSLFALQALSGPLGLPATAEVGTATGFALILQVAALVLALSLPLLSDDLDLAAGPLLLLGVYLVRAPQLVPEPGFWLAAQPDALPGALGSAALVGAALGLGHGLLATALRLPVALVTLVGGGGLALYLLAQPGIARLPLGSTERLTTLEPTLVIFGATLALLCVVGWLTRTRRASAAVDASGSAEQRIPLRRAVWLALPLALTLGQVRLAWSSWPALLLLALIVAGTTGGLGWALRPREPGEQRARLGRLYKLVLPTLLVIGISGQLLGLGPLTLIVLVPLAGLVALGMAVIARQLTRGRARRWIGLEQPPQRSALLRIIALTVSGAVAAAIGGCVGAQGIRDGTPVHALAFYSIVPLAGLLIGGQHRVPERLRLLGALLGALVAGGQIPLGGDNLDAPAMTLLLAALVSTIWGWVLPPAQPATTDPLGQPDSADLLIEAEPPAQPARLRPS